MFDSLRLVRGPIEEEMCENAIEVNDEQGQELRSKAVPRWLSGDPPPFRPATAACPG